MTEASPSITLKRVCQLEGMNLHDIMRLDQVLESLPFPQFHFHCIGLEEAGIEELSVIRLTCPGNGESEILEVAREIELRFSFVRSARRSKGARWQRIMVVWPIRSKRRGDIPWFAKPEPLMSPKGQTVL